MILEVKRYIIHLRIGTTISLQRSLRMAGLYFYAPRDKISEIVSCGLKLSEWYDRQIILPGHSGERRLLKAHLNPRDNEVRLKDPNYRCLRLEVDANYCIVGDATLYEMGLKEPELMERYKNTLTPLKDYRFGTFREPEVLVMTSVLPDSIEVAGIAMDIPILYESSSALYLSNILEKHEETWNDSGNHLLYAYYLYLESKGRVTQFKDKEHAVFFHRDSKEYVALKIPKEESDVGG